MGVEVRAMERCAEVPARACAGGPCVRAPVRARARVRCARAPGVRAPLFTTLAAGRRQSEPSTDALARSSPHIMTACTNAPFESKRAKPAN